MSSTISVIENEAQKIILKIKSGELIDGCSMSAIQTPTIEAWEVATNICEIIELTSMQKTAIFSKLGREVRSQLGNARYDDFDLIYERLLQLINKG